MAGLACTMACFQPREQATLLVVRVEDDQGVPQRAVSVELDGVPSATTGDAGTASITLQTYANRIQIAAHCPEGYNSPDPRSVPLSRSGRQPPLELRFVCRPAMRTLLLVVRAPQAAGLSVLADGESLGTVNADGTLHAVLRRPPEAVIRLMLDTSALPRAVPANPVREIRVADRDEILVFDQSLAIAPPARRAPSPRRAPPDPSKSHIPYAIGSRF
jgi:hypothetical protein